jgi:hypothetical protein
MSTSPQQIETDALGLPASERAHLARRLIESLEEEVEDPAEVERAWKAKIQTTPDTDVLSEARRRLR